MKTTPLAKSSTALLLVKLLKINTALHGLSPVALRQLLPWLTQVASKTNALSPTLMICCHLKKAL
jgi:hypothetical protein